MANPTVSVVMPVYHHSKKQLLRAIDSILNQTFRNFELIIVDGNQTQFNQDIIQQMTDDRIRYFRCVGYINCLNFGIQKSKGKYIARMDSDDISHPTRLAEQVSFLDKNPHIDLCSCRVRFFGDVPDYYSKYTKVSLFNMMTQSEFIHPAMMFRRNLKIQYEKLKPLEDCLLFRRLLLAGKKFGIIDRVLFDYHISKNSIMAKHPKLVSNYLSKMNFLALVQYTNYQISFAHNILTKHHFSIKEQREFFDFTDMAQQKFKGKLDILSLFYPYFLYIKKHTESAYLIYFSKGYYKTYFMPMMRKNIKQFLRFIFSVHNERNVMTKRKIICILGQKIPVCRLVFDLK